MKSKRIGAKGGEPRILGEEAEKLKDKLDQLKAQIKVKKQQKQMSKTSTSVYSSKSQALPSSRSGMNATQTSFTEKSSFHEVLVELKFQNIELKLKDKNILTLEQLQGINSEQIDQWRDIPVGYRIKLKKYIQKIQTKEPTKSQTCEEQQEQQEKPNQKIEEELPDIESIIKNRKLNNIFVPINRPKDEESEGEGEEELKEEEQEQMMLSIMQTLGGKQRTSNLKTTEKKEAKHVHWSPKVDQMESQHSPVKEYPKQKIPRSVFESTQKEQTLEELNQDAKVSTQDGGINTVGEYKQFPDYKYCWVCYKKLEKNILHESNRDFCGQKCISAYEQTVDQKKLEQVVLSEELEAEDSAKLLEKSEEPCFELDFDMV